MDCAAAVRGCTAREAMSAAATIGTRDLIGPSRRNERTIPFPERQRASSIHEQGAFQDPRSKIQVPRHAVPLLELGTGNWELATSTGRRPYDFRSISWHP